MSLATRNTAQDGLRHGTGCMDASRVRATSARVLRTAADRALHADASGAFGWFCPTIQARGAPGEETTRP